MNLFLKLFITNTIIKNNIGIITNPDGIKRNKDYWSISIYYPIDNSDKKYPAISFMPGFLGGRRHLIQWCEFLASNGVICVAVEPRSIFHHPKKRAYGLKASLERLLKENTNPKSPLYNKVMTNSLAVGGASMGGGGAYLSNNLSKLIKANILVVPWLNQYDLERLDKYVNNIPTLFIGGDSDTTAPIEKYLNKIYELNNSTKIKYILKDSGHDSGSKPNMYENELGTMVLNWIKYILLDDMEIEKYFHQIPKGAIEYVYKKNDKEIISGSYNFSKNYVKKGEFSYNASLKEYFRSWVKSNL